MAQLTVEQAKAAVNKLEGKATTKAKFWEHVDEMLTFITDQWPHEIYALIKDAEEKRLMSKNKFHASSDLSSRITGGVPPRLHQLIIHIYGEDIPYPSHKELWNEFFRRYPDFAYAEKI